MKIVYQNIIKPYDISEIINNNPLLKELFLLFKELEQKDVVDKISHDEYGILFSNYIEILSRFLFSSNDYIINCNLLEELTDNITVIAVFIYYTYFIQLDEFSENEENIKFYSNFFLPKDTKFNNPKKHTNSAILSVWKKFDEKIKSLIIKENIHQIHQFCDQLIQRQIHEFNVTLLPKIRTVMYVENSIQSDRIIFKNDGLKIFNYLVANHPNKKNRAFFSYIFFFLQKKDKLQITSNESKDYRKYILQTFNLDSYTRIINSNSNNKFKEKEIESEFENILKSYSNTN